MMRPLAIDSRLHTEFGLALLAMVLEIPGARAAVLSDDKGDAIDFVHDPKDVTELDVQLLGAQIGQSVLRICASARRVRLEQASLMVEASEGTFLAAAIGQTYVVALLLARRANLAAALRAFSAARAVLDRLLP